MGVPFNLCSYALLTHIVAKICGLKPGVLSLTGVDWHIYKNHVEAVKLQSERKPYPFPTFQWSERVEHAARQGTLDIDDWSKETYTEDDFCLNFYAHHPPIRATMAI